MNPLTISSNIRFNFRNKKHNCNIYIDSSAYPCFIFVILIDKELINEFGDEITIKTDCEKRLSKMDDYVELVELRNAIFDVVSSMPEFSAAKSRMMNLRQFQNTYLSALSYY